MIGYFHAYKMKFRDKKFNRALRLDRLVRSS